MVQKPARMTNETLLIIDFGSQYTQLIARRVRELNVYSEIHPFYDVPPLNEHIKGIVFSGSPASVHDAEAPQIDLNNYLNKLPVLGICYGAQMIAHKQGGTVSKATHREYGRARLQSVKQADTFMKGVSEGSQVWMSHGDTVAELPAGYQVIASTASVKVAAFANTENHIYGLQFHPEVTHSDGGSQLISSFLNLCDFSRTFTPESFVEETVAELKQTLGSDQVVMGLSGGVDSTVAATLLHKAIGKNLHCIFVDNGLLRKDEFEEVLQSYENMGLNITGVRAKDEFYRSLKSITDPEAKRKAIGRTFIEVFDREAHRIKNVKWLGQGTIYPDVIESVSVKGPSVTIKSHHNVGGLPEKMHMKVVEPLRMLFKDGVREVGKSLDIPPNILGRHPFPGPGLGIRILGDITAQKVAILQEVDHIFISSLKSAGLYDSVWQAGSILLPVQSVGVMGDERTYEQVVALRAVSSVDGMTADWVHLPYDFLADVSNRIINEVKGVNRVVYDISSKPPATIEWE